jgi:hypothetical protein
MQKILALFLEGMKPAQAFEQWWKTGNDVKSPAFHSDFANRMN